MKRTVFAKFEVEDKVNNGFVVNTLEKQALKIYQLPDKLGD